MRVLIPFVLLAGCQQPPPDDSPGGRLEAAAIARGMVADPSSASPVGAWAADTDRMCAVPDRAALRFGASVDYGEGQACEASGSATQQGGRLKVRFGDCRFDARFEGDRIVFPVDLPDACTRLCSGRASLAALTVERQSESVSEAASLRGPEGKLLCAGPVD